MTTCLWFKRDLRVADHPALTHAVALGDPVLCLYVVEPDLWRQSDASGRQFAFLRESLVALGEDLARRGAALVVRLGDAVEVLEDLRLQHGITQLISHEETGNLWTFARDRRVAAWARGQGVAWCEVPQSGVVRRLSNRDSWQSLRDRFMAAGELPAPDHIVAVTAECRAIPEAGDLGLAPDPVTRPQPGGSAAAARLLDSFLTSRAESYRWAMSTPLEGAKACSRLSPHFALGTVSIRHAVAETAAVQARAPSKAWAQSLKSFQARLAWRDHFMQKLEDTPEIETQCMHSAYEGLRPRVPDATRLAAWASGETGLPFVDACMRSLQATGWLNFRMRSMVMAVASYHLWLDWRATGAELARMFTDYEPGIHWPQVQMQSGTTGMNTLRIYNPVKQGHDQDPSGVFTRRWLPELAEVPDHLLQEPWRWERASDLLDHGYPAPIVDPQQAARHAREAVWAVRKGDGFRAEKQAVIARHASRKASRKRSPRRATTPSPQLSFDL